MIKSEELLYEKPETHVLEVFAEGVLCSSELERLTEFDGGW